MGTLKDTIKEAVCSDTGKLLLPAVPGLAVGALTSWSGPGAIAAGSAAGMATSAAQQEYCDGKVDPIKTVVGGMSGAGGTVVALGGKALLIGAGAMAGTNPPAVQKVTDAIQRTATTGTVDIVAPTAALGLVTKMVVDLSTHAQERELSHAYARQEQQESPNVEGGERDQILRLSRTLPADKPGIELFEHNLKKYQALSNDKAVPEAERRMNNLRAEAWANGLKIINERKAAPHK